MKDFTILDKLLIGNEKREANQYNHLKKSLQQLNDKVDGMPEKIVLPAITDKQDYNREFDEMNQSLLQIQKQLGVLEQMNQTVQGMKEETQALQDDNKRLEEKLSRQEALLTKQEDMLSKQEEQLKKNKEEDMQDKKGIDSFGMRFLLYFAVFMGTAIGCYITLSCWMPARSNTIYSAVVLVAMFFPIIYTALTMAQCIFAMIGYVSKKQDNAEETPDIWKKIGDRLTSILEILMMLSVVVLWAVEVIANHRIEKVTGLPAVNALAHYIKVIFHMINTDTNGIMILYSFFGIAILLLLRYFIKSIQNKGKGDLFNHVALLIAVLSLLIGVYSIYASNVGGTQQNVTQAAVQTTSDTAIAQ